MAIPNGNSWFSVAANSSRPSGEWSARAAAATVFLLAAGLTFYGARNMDGGMATPGGWTMPMMWMVMPGQSFWYAGWSFLLMWQAMMAVMMLPSTWPVLALYRRVALLRELPRASLGTAMVGAGYFSVWLAFGALGFGLGLAVSSWGMHSEAISRLVPPAAGVALVLAGIYQLTPLKQACLDTAANRCCTSATNGGLDCEAPFDWACTMARFAPLAAGR